MPKEELLSNRTRNHPAFKECTKYIPLRIEVEKKIYWHDQKYEDSMNCCQHCFLGDPECKAHGRLPLSRIRCLLFSARCMLKFSSFPPKLWGFGVKQDFPLLTGKKKDCQLDHQKAERFTFPFANGEYLGREFD